MPDIPSYTSGFAPRDGEAAHPQLWRGCVGAWHPGLGPTGLTLRDWSGQGTNGTLTNMDPATDWVVGEHGYVLTLSSFSDDDYIETTPAQIHAYGTCSVTFWINASTSDSRYIIAEGNSATNTPLYLLGQNSSGKVRVFIRDDANSTRLDAYSTTSAIDNTWHHVAWVDDNGNGRLFIDGAEDGTSFVYTPTTLTTDRSAIGSLLRVGQVGGIDGDITDVRFYNRPLSANEIQLLAQRPGIAYELTPIEWAPAAAPPPAGLGIPIAAYHYNHNVGSNL